VTKVLVFGDDDTSKDRYRFLYQGLCQSAKTRAPRDLRVLKVEGSIRRKLADIGVPDAEVSETPASRFQFVPLELRGPAIVEIDADELKVLTEYVPAAEWTVMVADVVADAVEWVSVAPDKATYQKTLGEIR
jgi:hypothetical protein